jgi:hypothetical protein
MKLWQYVTQSRPFGCSAKVQEVKQVSEYDLAITADPSCIACWGAERLLVPRYSNETAISQCGNQTKCYLPTETNLGAIGLHRSTVMFRTEDGAILGFKTTNMTAFWDMSSCSLIEKYRRFRGAYCLLSSGRLPLERRSTLTELRGAICQKAIIIAAVRTWKLAIKNLFGKIDRYPNMLRCYIEMRFAGKENKNREWEGMFISVTSITCSVRCVRI